MKNNLPPSWESMSVAKAADNISLTGYKLPQAEYHPNGTLPVIDQGQTFVSGYTDETELQIPCDLPVVVFGDHTRAIKYVDFDFVAGADGIKVLKPKSFYNTRLFYYFLKAIELPNKGYSRHFKFLASSDIPLPPFREQSRIADKLDAVMQKLEASQERLDKLPDLLKKFRQAVLAAAVSGKLTEAWRAEQPQGETGADLLDRIRAERRAQWEDKQRAKLSGKQLSLNDSWKLKYEEPAAPDTSELPELPEGWTYGTLEQVTDATRVICYGILMPKDNVAEGVLYVKVRDMKGDKIDISSLSRTTPEIAKAYERASLREGDILLSIRGTYGRIALVPKELEGGNITQDTARIALVHGIEKYYAATYLRSQIAQNYFQSIARGMAVKGVNIGDIRPFPIAIPPREEQREIVRQVNHYFELADQLEARFEQAAAFVEQLPQALLAKAFSGQLVPQDPDDEPASALLERLHAEPATPAKGKRGRKAKVAADAPLFE